MTTDAELVEGALRGDARSFEQIMRAHNQRLFRAARAILRDDAEAEDAVQQAYLRAHRGLASFRGEAALSTWLTRIVIRVALRRARQRGEAIELRESLDSKQPTPEDRAMVAELRVTLESAIDRLAPPYRLVFVMRDVQGLSTKETSECLQLSEEAVRVRLHRARGSLRTLLSSELELTPGDAFAFAGERCDRIVASVIAALNLEASRDDQLVRGVAAGDRGALGELFDRHSHAVFASVLRRVPRARAEDVVHDAFLELWRSAHRVPARTSVRAWLSERARQRC